VNEEEGGCGLDKCDVEDIGAYDAEADVVVLLVAVEGAAAVEDRETVEDEFKYADADNTEDENDDV
jgi:hypothetical protein